ncbi:hypothetical protein OKA06_12505 [Novosphingobium sp. MW5]|nr:hypothetical protein [Novosphingobium sp. MW5]
MADFGNLWQRHFYECRMLLQFAKMLNARPKSGLNHVAAPRLNLPRLYQAAVKELLASIPVPAKMYRHFATITIMITACIALFADGERREAIGAEIREDRQRQEMRALDAQRNGPTRIGSKQDVQIGNGFSEETNGDFDTGSTDPDRPSEVRSAVAQFHPAGDVSTKPPGYFDPGAGLPKGPQISPGAPKKLKKVTPVDMQKINEAGETRAGAATQAGS